MLQRVREMQETMEPGETTTTSASPHRHSSGEVLWTDYLCTPNTHVLKSNHYCMILGGMDVRGGHVICRVLGTISNETPKSCLTLLRCEDTMRMWVLSRNCIC